MTCDRPTCDGFAAALAEGAAALGWSSGSRRFGTRPGDVLATVRAAIARRPDAVVVEGAPRSGFAAAMPEAARAGVPIVTRQDRAQQLARLGRVTGDFIVADGAGKANVLLVRYAGDPSGATAMTAARRRVDTTCPDCRTRLIRVAAGQASEQIVAAIQRDPHIDYVGLEDGSMATGLADALQSAGLSGCACSPVNPRGAQQLRVVGINASRQTLESVADGDGTMRAFVQGPSARWLAYAGLDAVARRLVGDPRQRIAMPIEIVTKQTIAAAPARELAPDVPADLAGQFAALWLVP